MTETTELIQRIIEGIQEKKGHDIVHINLNNLEYASATSFVIGTGNTKIQVEAIADSVREYVQEKTGQKPFNYDGYQNSQWIVIDYGTVFAEYTERYVVPRFGVCTRTAPYRRAPSAMRGPTRRLRRD